MSTRSDPGHANGHGSGRRKPKPPPPLPDLDSAVLVHRAARTREPIPAEQLARLRPEWSEAVLLALDDGPEGVGHWLKVLRVRLRDEPGRFEAIARAVAEARDALADETAEVAAPAEPAGPKRFELGAIDAADFALMDFPREWIVEGVSVARESIIVGGDRKALKTSTQIDYSVSVAGAFDFLGRFRVPRPRRTLFISGESGPATILETYRRVCAAKGVDPAELRGWLYFAFNLPRLSDPDDLEVVAEFIRRKDLRGNGIECVTIDPLYLCLLSGGAKVDAANLFDVGPLLKRIADVCLDAGATPCLVHHLRKGRADRHAPPELEDLAFAGVQEFARQWILMGRRELYEPGSGEHKLWLSVGGSAGHSGLWAVDVSEGVVDREFRDRTWQVAVTNPSDVRAEARQLAEAERQRREAERTKAKGEHREAEDRIAMAQAVALFVAQVGRKLTSRRLRTLTGWRPDKADRIIARLEAAGCLVPTTVTTSAGNGKFREYPGYHLVSDVIP